MLHVYISAEIPFRCHGFNLYQEERDHRELLSYGPVLLSDFYQVSFSFPIVLRLNSTPAHISQVRLQVWVNI